MPKNLVIVESPAKAKTIEKFLGKDYTVTSSYGHIRDLPKKGMSIDIANNFEPEYTISPDKKKRVSELKKLAKSADTVWLATDEDREGEAIAWHLCQALGLKETETKRIVFHEITKPAITKAIEKPRTIDKNLVDAQQARRVLDRLVGYELSPVLWKKVRAGLSAGRVQSVAVRLIVEREREVESFTASSKYKVTAEFKLTDGTTLQAELPAKFNTKPEAKAFLEKVIGAEYKVANLEVKPGTKSPPPPFTTSTLQQAASSRLGFSVKQTMVVAQKLYEAGKITYMRTDSVALADSAVKQAASVIAGRFGNDYVHTRQFKTKSAGAQEAHEAIRPTDLSKENIQGESGHQKLYRLIWQRALASQMAAARIEKTTLKIAISTTPEELNAYGEVVVFPGFLNLQDKRQEDVLLPPVKVGEPLELIVMRATQNYQRPPARYTEASLVRKLEEMGIGRPSTYAPTISTVQDRGYVEKADKDGVERTVEALVLESGQILEETTTEMTGTEKGKLFPTPIGMLVTDFLVKYFPNIVDYNFTASVENEFDAIAEGKKVWNTMIADFYAAFHKTVTESADISRAEAAQARQLGTDPTTGKPIIARMGRFGPMLQIGQAEDEEKPQFAPIPPGKTMDNITLVEALELFALPKVLGKTVDGQEIAANFGRFGPYIKYGSTYVSIKPDDPFTITLERALELIAEKDQQDANKYIHDFGTVKVLRGRFGPYVTDGKKNAKIPKAIEPESLDEKAAKELLAKAPLKKPRRKR